MTDPRYQHDILIIDRSGSMASICEGMTSGLTEFIDGQQRLLTDGTLGRVTGSLWQFDDITSCVHSLAAVSELRSYQLIPRGLTALCDAVTLAVTAEGGKLAAMPEARRPGQVVVVIVSDGLENASKEVTPARVAELKQRQERDYNWRFAFLGCGQEVFAQGITLGMAGSQSLRFTSTSRSAAGSWSATSAAVTRYTVDATQAAATGTAMPGLFYTSQERDQVTGA